MVSEKILEYLVALLICNQRGFKFLEYGMFDTFAASQKSLIGKYPTGNYYYVVQFGSAKHSAQYTQPPFPTVRKPV